MFKFSRIDRHLVFTRKKKINKSRKSETFAENIFLSEKFFVASSVRNERGLIQNVKKSARWLLVNYSKWRNDFFPRCHEEEEPTLQTRLQVLMPSKVEEVKTAKAIFIFSNA